MSTLSNRGARRAIVQNARQISEHQQGIALVARDVMTAYQRLDALEAWAEELSKPTTFGQRLAWLFLGVPFAKWTKAAKPARRVVTD